MNPVAPDPNHSDKTFVRPTGFDAGSAFPMSPAMSLAMSAHTLPEGTRLRGFRENIVGSGSDNAVDALDRRVEFKIVPCG